MATKRVFIVDLLYVIAHNDIHTKGGKRKLIFPLILSSEFQEMSIAEIDFSDRALNALQRNGYKKVFDVLLNYVQLKNKKCCDEKTVREIKYKCLRCWYDNLKSEELEQFWVEFVSAST